MNLIEIDIVGPEPSQAGIDFAHDCFARQAASVGVRTHLVIDLGRDYYLFTPGKVPERSPKNLFTRAVRVGISRVKEVDAKCQRLLDKGAPFFLNHRPRMRAALG